MNKQSDPVLKCRALKWDSDFFGFPIGKLQGRLLREKIPDVLAWSQKNRIRCLYFLCPPNDLPSITSAENLGFHLVDIRCDYTAPMRQIASPAGSIKGLQAPLRKDVPDLQMLAATAFEDSRFNFDPQFHPKRVAEMYRLWIKKSCDGWADKVWIIRQQGQVTGFITCHLEEAGRAGRIGLFAVKKKFRSHGVGSSLMAAAGDYFIKKGVRQFKITTQGRNIPAQCLFAKFGLRIAAMHLWYHKWFDL